MKHYGAFLSMLAVVAGTAHGQALIQMAPVDVGPEFLSVIPHERYLMSITEVTNEQFAQVVNASDRFRVDDIGVWNEDFNYGHLDKLNLHTFPKLMLPKDRLSGVHSCHNH